MNWIGQQIHHVVSDGQNHSLFLVGYIALTWPRLKIKTAEKISMNEFIRNESLSKQLNLSSFWGSGHLSRGERHRLSSNLSRMNTHLTLPPPSPAALTPDIVVNSILASVLIAESCFFVLFGDSADIREPSSNR